MSMIRISVLVYPNGSFEVANVGYPVDLIEAIVQRRIRTPRTQEWWSITYPDPNFYVNHTLDRLVRTAEVAPIYHRNK